jgi:hypothetical protein
MKSYSSVLCVSDKKALRGYSKKQKNAYSAYKFAVMEEDRYLGSVFVTGHGQREVEKKTREAYERCRLLGIGHLC